VAILIGLHLAGGKNAPRNLALLWGITKQLPAAMAKSVQYCTYSALEITYL
jgi:hypothetical protein